MTFNKNFFLCKAMCEINVNKVLKIKYLTFFNILKREDTGFDFLPNDYAS